MGIRDPWGLAGLGLGWGLKASSRASGFVGCLFLSPWSEWGMGKVPSLPGLCSSCRDGRGGGTGSWEGPMKERVVGTPQIPSMLKSLGRGGGVFPQLLGKPWESLERAGARHPPCLCTSLLPAPQRDPAPGLSQDFRKSPSVSEWVPWHWQPRTAFYPARRYLRCDWRVCVCVCLWCV